MDDENSVVDEGLDVRDALSYVRTVLT